VLSTPSEKLIPVRGLRLRCRDEGTGPPVLLVHGIGASLEYWRYTIPALVDRHRVLAVDLPGCGFSERGPVLPTLPETADLIASLLDTLALPKVSLIGNSLGGLVSLETALRHPERVDRLILSNSAGLGREVSPFWRLVSLPPLGKLLIGINQWSGRRGGPNFFYNPRGEPTVAARCRQWVARPDLVDTIVGAASSGVELSGQRPEILRLDRLSELTVPTLLVWGRRDWIIPVTHGERAQKLIPNAQLVVFEDCMHCPQLECPAAFNQVARAFLAGEPLPA
jgi:pimeloyl-ACP methyl ester carboxylesterase